MRDDIHKRVARPPSVQRWVRCAVNEADRKADRSIEALKLSIVDSCRRDLSKQFVQALTNEMARPREFFARLSNAPSPRDLGGRGGPLEFEVLSEAKRLIASGIEPKLVVARAVEHGIQWRCEADIREAAAVFPNRDTEAVSALSQMRHDLSRVGISDLATSVCDSSIYSQPLTSRSRVDLDENMLGGAH